MSTYFHTITENNKLSLDKPSDSDLVYFSELNEWYTRNAFRSFCLKYVVDQCIYYKVGSQEYEVNGGSFLLACKQPDVQAYFDSKKVVKSICIDICPATVHEAFTVISSREDHALDNYLAGYFNTPQFFECVCPAGNAGFGDQLNELVTAIYQGKANEHLNKEWFLQLVEKIIYHEYGNYLSLNDIPSVKLETRKEILRRLKVGRQYMDDEFLSIPDINTVAVYCNMSQFHFYRSFKQAFGVSPYQYLLGRRLLLAKEMVCQDKLPLTAIASHCNFPDLFTFSKAFKRKFNIAPSLIHAKK